MHVLQIKELVNMKSIKITFIRLLPVLLLIIVAHPSFAVEVAPRISDREIIESLAERSYRRRIWIDWFCSLGS